MSAISVYDQARAAFDVYAANSKDCLSLKEPAHVQEQLARWQNTKFGAVPIEQSALGVAEELGELAEAFMGLAWSTGRLAHAVLKYRQKTRGVDTVEKLRALAADAMADMMVFAAGLATGLRLDLWTLYRETAIEVMNRGGDAVPVLKEPFRLIGWVEGNHPIALPPRCMGKRDLGGCENEAIPTTPNRLLHFCNECWAIRAMEIP